MDQYLLDVLVLTGAMEGIAPRTEGFQSRTLRMPPSQAFLRAAAALPFSKPFPSSWVVLRCTRSAMRPSACTYCQHTHGGDCVLPTQTLSSAYNGPFARGTTTTVGRPPLGEPVRGGAADVRVRCKITGGPA